MDERVSVWLCSTDRVADLRPYEGLLSDCELRRAETFTVGRRRAQYVLARALLRQALSDRGGYHPGEWRFEVDEHGRPALAPGPWSPLRIDFNLSHTPGLVGCALVQGARVGFDVEWMSERRDIVALAEVCLSDRERARLDTADRTRVRTAEFYRLWTLKEALLKATGTGLGTPLRTISFGVVSPRPERRPPNPPEFDGIELEAGFDLAAQFFSALQSRHAIGLAILSDRRLAIEVRQPALLAA